MNAIFFKASPDIQRRTPSFAYKAPVMSDKAIRAYAEMRVRGYSLFESFVSAFGQEIGGHPDALTAAAAEYEQTAEYRKTHAAVMAEYTPEQLRNFWKKHEDVALLRAAGAQRHVKAKLDAMPEQEEERDPSFVGMQKANKEADSRELAAIERKKHNVSDYGDVFVAEPVRAPLFNGMD